MRTMDDFPLPAGEDWEDLFTLFLSLDDHKKRPGKEWYAKAKVVLDKIGHDKYLDITANWLIAKCEQLERNIKRLDDLWKGEGRRLYLDRNFLLTRRMNDVLKNQRPAWVDVVLGDDYFYTKENPFNGDKDGLYYFYTLGGRILRGTLHTNMILENEVLYDMMDVLMRLCPAISMDVLHIYANQRPEFAVPRLMVVRDAIRHKTYRKAMDTAIANMGSKENKAAGAEMMKERFIPDMDFNHRHQLLVKDGSYAMGIDLMVSGPKEVVVLENGRPAVKVPAAVKKILTERFAPYKKKHKEISAHYTLQKNRLEEIYRHNREWKFEDWEPYYISHAFVGALGKLLIWEFVNDTQATTAICYKGAFVNSAGENVSWVEDANTIVRLWHPVTASREVIAGWRNYCMEHKLQQPFRQAFREVYRPNEANDITADHFDGLVVKEKQYNALCKVRGWSTGDFSHVDSSIRFPAYNLGAFMVIADRWFEGGSFNGSLLVMGDIYFLRRSAEVKIAEVPPVIFSEALRDMDMIVSVAAIGNEYTPVNEVMEKARTYFKEYTKRSLSPIGIVRRDILQLLLPQMAYSNRLKIDDQYLYVAGELANYKIHIGTSEIYNADTNKWIHIDVQLSATTAKMFLPDEGDIMLTVILSKANLLAEDNLIADKDLLDSITGKWR